MANIPEVRRGQRILADTTTALVRRVNAIPPAVLSGASWGTQGETGTNDNLIRVRNESGKALRRGGVAMITGASVPPVNELGSWAGILTVGAPDGTGKAVIAVQRIAVNALGWAMAYGVARTRVEMADGSHQYAEAAEEAPEALTSAESGEFRILWRDDKSPANALVQFPAGAAGRPVKAVWSPAAGSGGVVTVYDERWLPDPGADPNWEVIPSSAHQGRYHIGSGPANAEMLP